MVQPHPSLFPSSCFHSQSENVTESSRAETHMAEGHGTARVKWVTFSLLIHLMSNSDELRSSRRLTSKQQKSVLQLDRPGYPKNKNMYSNSFQNTIVFFCLHPRMTNQYSGWATFVVLVERRVHTNSAGDCSSFPQWAPENVPKQTWYLLGTFALPSSSILWAVLGGSCSDAAHECVFKADIKVSLQQHRATVTGLIKMLCLLWREGCIHQRKSLRARKMQRCQAALWRSYICSASPFFYFFFFNKLGQSKLSPRSQLLSPHTFFLVYAEAPAAVTSDYSKRCGPKRCRRCSREKICKSKTGKC